MKRPAIVFTIVVAIAFGSFVYLRTGPPKEAIILKNFRTHRSSFEQLRDMLQADESVSRLAAWGVDTKDRRIVQPPDGNFPVERYNKYLGLMKEVKAEGVARGEGAHPDLNILLWASGFGGDIVHVGICWMDKSPRRLISNLDAYYRNHKSSGAEKGWAFRPIEGNWYIGTDIASE